MTACVYVRIMYMCPVLCIQMWVKFLHFFLRMWILINHLTMDVHVSAKVAMESRQTEIRTNSVLLSSPFHCDFTSTYPLSLCVTNLNVTSRSECMQHKINSICTTSFFLLRSLTKLTRRWPSLTQSSTVEKTNSIYMYCHSTQLSTKLACFEPNLMQIFNNRFDFWLDKQLKVIRVIPGQMYPKNSDPLQNSFKLGNISSTP